MLSGPHQTREPLPIVAALLLLAGSASPIVAQAGTEPAAVQPDAQPAVAEVPPSVQPADDLDEEFAIGPFAEPIDINTFVDLVAEALEINVTKDASLGGQIAFNSTMTITKRDLLPLLDLRLEELGFTIVPDPLGFYTIRRADQVVVNPNADGTGTTRFIATPGLRPSALSGIISTQLTLSRVSYEDELGVIVVTDTPRRIAQLESLVNALIEQRKSMVTEAIPLRFISAPVALERAIERLGGGSASTAASRALTPQQIQQQAATQGIAGLGGGTQGLTNLAQRLTTDPAGNALIFLGLPEELQGVREIIAAVDKQNDLISEKYFTGSATRVIADLAERQGFGRVIEAPRETTTNIFNINRFQQDVNNQLSQTADSGESGGSQLLVDQDEGMITYFGTPEQQASFSELIEGFDTEDEIIVVEPYKLQYSDAADVAEILQSLISRSSPQGDDNPFLPQNQQAAAQQIQQFFDPEAGSQSADGGITILGNDSFVFADEANNQVLVQAPRSQQEAFGKLIEQIDLRRPQVYIEATIIAVTDTDNFRLAIETAFQDLNGEGDGFGAQTNFGLSVPGVGGFTDPRTIATGLSGLTSAVIRTEYVPFIINATKTNGTSRIVATPQLLVDDNAQSTISTEQTQPFEVTTTTDFAQNITFEEATAQTSLTITPQISTGGTVRLEYEILQQTFTALPGDGSPPPTLTNSIDGESVTVPNGGTVVIGGLGITNQGETVVKVPLLGDIPLIGQLFRDTSRDLSETKLYVFLTPRVLRDPDLNDYRLLSLGPFAEVEFEDYIPELDAVMIKSSPTGAPTEEPIDESGFVLPSDRNPSLNQQELRPENDKD